MLAPYHLWLVFVLSYPALRRMGRSHHECHHDGHCVDQDGTQDARQEAPHRRDPPFTLLHPLALRPSQARSPLPPPPLCIVRGEVIPTAVPSQQPRYSRRIVANPLRIQDRNIHFAVPLFQPVGKQQKCG